MSLLVVRYRIIKDSSSYITKKPIPAWLTIHRSYSQKLSAKLVSSSPKESPLL